MNKRYNEGATMTGRILMPQGMRVNIQRVLGYSQPTIRRALNGADDTRVAHEIRSFALEHGGVLVETEMMYVRTGVHTWKRVKRNG